MVCPSNSVAPPHSLHTTCRAPIRVWAISAAQVQTSRLLSHIHRKPRSPRTAMLTCRTHPSTIPRLPSKWHQSHSRHHQLHNRILETPHHFYTTRYSLFPSCLSFSSRTKNIVSRAKCIFFLFSDWSVRLMATYMAAVRPSPVQSSQVYLFHVQPCQHCPAHLSPKILHSYGGQTKPCLRVQSFSHSSFGPALAYTAPLSPTSYELGS